MSVKRWICVTVCDDGEMIENDYAGIGNDDLEYVLASDYDALVKRCEAAEANYRRWHAAFLEAKYPDVRPTRVDLERRIARLESLLRRVLNTGLIHAARNPEPPHLWQEIDAELLP